MAFKWLPVVDPDLCDGCGSCSDACGPRCLKTIARLATLTDPNLCGSEEHCIAPCRRAAIRMDWVRATGDRAVGRWRDSDPKRGDR